MNEPAQHEKPKRPRLILGDDGEIIDGTLPIPEHVSRPIRLLIPLSIILTAVVVVIVVTFGTLSVLGIIRPKSWISSITRPICFSRLGTERILFLSQRDGDNGFFVMNADGSNVCRLIDDSIVQGYPKPSPDGKLIYYVMRREGRSDIMVVSNNGSAPKPFYTIGDLRDEGLAISPDGKRFAVTKEVGSNYGQLYLMDLDGANAIRVSPGNADAYLPDWSPDGSKVAFVSETDGTPHIYIIHADGTDLHRLTTTQNAETRPAWSPDSHQIAFARDAAGNGSNSQIFLTNADGSNIRQITHDGTGNAFPRFSPDGKRIIYTSDRSGEGLDLYVMNVDGSNVQRLTSSGNNSYPVWLH